MQHVKSLTILILIDLFSQSFLIFPQCLKIQNNGRVTDMCCSFGSTLVHSSVLRLPLFASDLHRLMPDIEVAVHFCTVIIAHKGSRRLA